MRHLSFSFKISHRINEGRNVPPRGASYFVGETKRQKLLFLRLQRNSAAKLLPLIVRSVSGAMARDGDDGGTEEEMKRRR